MQLIWYFRRRKWKVSWENASFIFDIFALISPHFPFYNIFNNPKSIRPYQINAESWQKCDTRSKKDRKINILILITSESLTSGSHKTVKGYMLWGHEEVTWRRKASRVQHLKNRPCSCSMCVNHNHMTWIIIIGNWIYWIILWKCNCRIFLWMDHKESLYFKQPNWETYWFEKIDKWQGLD